MKTSRVCNVHAGAESGFAAPPASHRQHASGTQVPSASTTNRGLEALVHWKQERVTLTVSDLEDEALRAQADDPAHATPKEGGSGR